MAPRASHNITIDVLKGLLVIGMVLAHAISLLGNEEQTLWLGLRNLINLTAFSGFLFCFGYTCYQAYFRPSADLPFPYRRTMKTALKPLIAFYISALAYRFITANADFDSQTILNIVILRDLPDYSEFLVTFSMTLIIAVLLRKPIRIIIGRFAYFVATIMLILLINLVFTYSGANGYIGLLIGMKGYLVFPFLQYFPIFLLGVYFSKQNIWYVRWLLVALVVLSLIILVLDRSYALMERFPPSSLWLIVSFAYVYVTAIIAEILSKSRALRHVLASIGGNTLFYLLLSNIVLFSMHTVSAVKYTHEVCLIVTLVLMMGIYFCTTLVRSQRPPAVAG